MVCRHQRGGRLDQVRSVSVLVVAVEDEARSQEEAGQQVLQGEGARRLLVCQMRRLREADRSTLSVLAMLPVLVELVAESARLVHSVVLDVLSQPTGPTRYPSGIEGGPGRRIAQRRRCYTWLVARCQGTDT